MKSLPFLKGLSWLLVLNILVKPAWIFFIDRQVQNLVGNEVYGKYFALLSLSYLFYFLSDAGLSNMLNQRLAQGNAVNTKQFIRIKMVLLLIYVLACCF